MNTDFSNLRLRDCIIKVPALIDKAIELGHSCVAITDHETISSFVQVEEYAEKVKDKIKVIRGNEIYLTRNGLNASNFNKERGDDYYHFILLAKDLEGYHQLCELSTRAWLRSYVARRMRRVPTYYKDIKEIVGKNPGHLIASTACLGSQLDRFILKFRDTGDTDYLETAKNWCRYMVNIFGEENFYLELQPSKGAEQLFVNKYLLEFSKELNIPYIITTDSHYLSKSGADIHEKYLNSQDGDREVKSFYATTYMMGTEELESFFPYMSREQLDTAYANIENIAAMCEDFTIKKPLRIPELPWIDYPRIGSQEREELYHKLPSLRQFETSKYKADQELVFAVANGIHKHPDLQNEQAYKALDKCLEMTWISSQVNNACWAAYYLNLQKIIEECWNAGTIVGPARGSGGGFVLLYCLDLIQMNCLRENTQCFDWRFLNPERVSVLDLDTDISGLKRAQVLQHLREVYGEDRVCNVLTLRTEKSKSAILTAARGLGYTPEEGTYFASLIGMERGQLYSLSQMYYGDEEKGLAPSSTFIEAMDENPELWKVAKNIEGLICGCGIHAGGVVFNDEPFTNTCSLMRAPDGTIISGFELHDIEKQSLIKMDLLSIEGADKLQTCLELLVENGYVKPEPTLRETYEKVIGVYNMERDDPKMWKMVWNHEITSLFQMEQQSGIQGIALTKPKSVDELAVLNSVIRLMATEKGAEQPLNKWVRYREDINQWTNEMRQFGLTEDEIDWLSHHSAITDGVCESQEGMMSLVQELRLGGHTLGFADKCRKAIAKKQGKLFEECEQKFFETIQEKNLSYKLADYVWNEVLKIQRGYSFNRAHCLAYSLVALQEMNLAYKYPIIFWNTANLIVDSAGTEAAHEEDDEESLIVELEDEQAPEEEIVDIYEPEEWEEYEYEDLPDRSAKKKKKTKSINFGKIATAIGKFQAEGIEIASPDINRSGFTFTPVVETNTIVSGLRNLTRISADLVNTIISNRPYASLDDFLSRVKVNKTQMLVLIKSGAFDSLYPDRMGLLREYVCRIAGTKNNLTLANVPMLISYNVFADECDEYIELYQYNKFLRKKLDKETGIITLTNKAMEYYLDRFDPDQLLDSNSIAAKAWEKQYKKAIAPFSDFIKENKDILLDELNAKILEEKFDLNVGGNISHCEMEAMSFYYHPHELSEINRGKYEISRFTDLPEEPQVSREIHTKDGKTIPIYELSCIAGTVVDKNKMKNSISLLTPDGVVNVKIWKNQYAKYDKQISEIGPDGKKKVMERSWFKRGTLLYLQGMRRGNNFIPKTYKGSRHKVPIMKITEVNGGDIVFTNKRYDEE